MRSSSAIFGLATLLFGFVQAPFFHIHAEDLDHDHNSGPTHVHVRSVHSGPRQQFELHDADDDAIDVLWTISAPPGIHLFLPLEFAQRIPITAPLVASAVIPAVELHSHDPPLLNLQNPRPPPA